MWMMLMRNSVFDMHENLSSGMKTLKSLDYKYLNLNSIFTPLLMNYDLPKPGQHEQTNSESKAPSSSFLF